MFPVQQVDRKAPSLVGGGGAAFILGKYNLAKLAIHMYSICIS